MRGGMHANAYGLHNGGVVINASNTFCMSLMTEMALRADRIQVLITSTRASTIFVNFGGRSRV